MSEGQGGLEPRRQADLRVSHEDRERVAEVLRGAAGDGRITLEELDQRLDLAYAARTYADLMPLTADLPDIVGQQPTGPISGSMPVARHEHSFAMFGGSDRRGLWEISPDYSATAMCGGVRLDLRQARFAARETVIHAYAMCGGVEIVVNAHTHVIVEGIGIMGGFGQERDRVEPMLSDSSPVVRVRGFALMGGVSVTRRPMPGEEKRRALPR